MRLKQAAQHWKNTLMRVDDGALMRHAFHALLALSVVFVLIDWREFHTQQHDTPGYNPLEPGTVPVLPPALTEGEPTAPPSNIKSNPETLKQAIRFELQPEGVLLAQGAIEPGAAARFTKEIEARGEYVKTISLDSPGGAVGDALAMSKLIRERKLNTRVASGALCASSCPIILAGGVVREAETDAVVGVHQVFNGSKERLSPERAMSDAQRTTADVSRHLNEMGIKPGLWLHALETPPDRLYYLKPDEMRDLALTTTAAKPVAKKK